MTSSNRLIKNILFGRCPRCGKGKLFSGYLQIGAKCPECELDYGVFDPGDGPAVFVILIEGALIMGGVLWIEVAFSPPLWVHALIWIPTVTCLTLVLLRLVKSALLILQYKHRAGQGAIDPGRTKS